MAGQIERADTAPAYMPSILDERAYAIIAFAVLDFTDRATLVTLCDDYFVRS